ncbi:MAG TPA: MBL fold metallo-hydrolase [Eubacteriales bacterium]|nr:MBL fold metallo-hydrolase [Eubacteriales bacterium]
MKKSRFNYKRILPALAALFCAAGLLGCGVSPGDAAPAETPAAGAQPDADDFAVLFCNVGKADAAILRFGDSAVLIDTGSEESAPQLIAGLNLLGVEKIDAVFLTHSHADHTGGLSALAANYDIPMVYAPLYSEQTKKGDGVIVKLCERLELPHTELSAGDAVPVADGVTFDVLGPLSLNEDDDNDNSLVLRFTFGRTTFLFTGDMQFAEEDALLEAGTDVSADVLKVGNHGNPDATSEAFAQAVSPSLAVISTDTSVDKDSANTRVLAALSPAKICITQDYPIGVLLTLDESGEPAVSSPARQESGCQIAVFALAPDEQRLTIQNYGDTEADLSGCILYCDRSGAALRFPDGTLLGAGDSLTVSGADGGGDFEFSGEDKPLSKKKSNTVSFYSPLGEKVSELEQD